MSLYPLIINSTCLDSNDDSNSTYTYDFPTSATFKNASVAVESLSIYYSWFNISAANNNNSYSFIFPQLGSSPTYTVTMPDGFYDISSINTYLQAYCIEQGLYLVDSNGNYVYYIEFSTNSTYYSVQFNCFLVPDALPATYSNPASLTFPAVAATTQLIVPDSNFGLVIGQEAGTYPTVAEASTQSFLSTFTPQVSPINSLLLSCTLLNNKFSVPNTILYSFSPAGVSFGELISNTPSALSFVDIQDGQYQNFKIQFLDQNFNRVILQDSEIVLQLLIKT